MAKNHRVEAPQLEASASRYGRISLFVLRGVAHWTCVLIRVLSVAAMLAVAVVALGAKGDGDGLQANGQMRAMPAGDRTIDVRDQVEADLFLRAMLKGVSAVVQPQEVLKAREGRLPDPGRLHTSGVARVMKGGLHPAVANESAGPFALIVRNLASDGVRAPEPITLPTPAKALPTPEPGPVFAAERSVQEIIASYSWDVATALRVADCESGFRSIQNLSGYPYFGVYQVGFPQHADIMVRLDIEPTIAALLLPENNVAVAYALEEDEGWGPWLSSRGCWG